MIRLGDDVRPTEQLYNFLVLLYKVRPVTVVTVITMTSKVDGKTEISTHSGSETHKNIETKIGLNDYVIHP